jgi:hypothetical protein
MPIIGIETSENSNELIVNWYYFTYFNYVAPYK